MWDAVVNAYNWFVALMLTFKATDVLDIMVVSFIIYNLIKIMRETRAEQLVKGILVLLVAFFLSGIFNLKMLNALFTSFFQFSVLAVLIVFQPELKVINSPSPLTDSKSLGCRISLFLITEFAASRIFLVLR